MQRILFALALSAGIASTTPARADDGLSTLSAISALPVASIAVGASAAAASVVVLPAALSTTGAVLVVKTVESTARGTVCLLERLSDGAQASIEMAAGSVGKASLAAGTLVTVSAVGAGVVLSAAGEVVAFIPNAIGRALLHNERVTP